MKRALKGCVVAILLAPWATVTSVQAADALADPTRPPALLATAPSATGLGQIEPELQSVLISPKRREAVIDGAVVRAGDMVDGARVVRILEGEVVLRAGAEVRVLRMYPGIEKRSPSKGAYDRANRQECKGQWCGTQQ